MKVTHLLPAATLSDGQTHILFTQIAFPAQGGLPSVRTLHRCPGALSASCPPDAELLHYKVEKITNFKQERQRSKSSLTRNNSKELDGCLWITSFFCVSIQGYKKKKNASFWITSFFLFSAKKRCLYKNT